MFRRALLGSVAVAACLAGGVVQSASASSATDMAAITGPVHQFYGDIDPFYGDIDPFYGDIDPFYGDIDPFYGDIDPFYGDIDPFTGATNHSYGDISPFWGDIDPFWGDIDPFYGDIDPFYGDIDPFWGDIDPFWGDIDPFWSKVGPFWKAAGPEWGDINTLWNSLQSSDATDYAPLQTKLQDFLANAASVWGSAVQKYTGKGFADGFADAMLAKYGINPNDPASLANVDGATRSAFFLNWYDGLMNFTGVDHVDWWMPAINWSPMLEQTADTGIKVNVGVLDSTFTAAGADVDKVVFVGGYDYYVNDHGASVASLIAAKQDGHGVMGVAPDTVLTVYNPFDATGTASWQDVTNGIARLYDSGARVVNASLGVPGTVLSQEWVNILAGTQMSNRNTGTVIVKAAGNESITQTQDIAWVPGQEAPSNLILVGSANVDGQISPFSNRPGESCFTVDGQCSEQDKLKYRFLVAPGEVMLVSDGHGGVTRMSGTSFAAPLVTGAVALLQQRWPWLKDHAAETTQIIFRSAKDLGAPGVDPVYGWGELDVQASQSPLSFDDLVVYQPALNDGYYTLGGRFWSPSKLKSAVLDPGQLNLWQNKGAYLVAFESIGSTFRDFDIPLSTLLVGTKRTSGGYLYQSYLYDRLIQWANAPSGTGFRSQTVGFSSGDWKLSVVSILSTPEEVQQTGRSFHSEFVAEDAASGVGFRIGEGSGVHALAGASGFEMRSDFNPVTGGVNPVLGLASGGTYAQGHVDIGDSLTVRLGFTEKTDDHTYIDPKFGPIQSIPLAPNSSFAYVASLDYAVLDGVSVDASYTNLTEARGLFGAQGGGALAMTGGSSTQAATVGAKASFGDGWTVSGTATFARSAAPQFQNSALSFDHGTVSALAYELAARKAGLFTEADNLRVSLTQPLHVEQGSLRYTALEVVDRETGKLGAVTQSWSIAGKPEYRMETVYSLPFWDDRASLDGYGLVRLNPSELPRAATELAAGAELRFSF